MKHSTFIYGCGLFAGILLTSSIFEGDSLFIIFIYPTLVTLLGIVGERIFYGGTL